MATLETGFTSHHKTVSTTSDWYTPKYIIDALGPFDLDVCTSMNRPFNTALVHNVVEIGGGEHMTWVGYSWCNPPYGPQAKFWLNRMREHNNGIVLTFARTETKYFQEMVKGAKGFLFLKKRLVFLNAQGEKPKHNAGAPSVLIAYGDYAWFRLKTCGLEGLLLRYE